jgi:hypothetical protein
MRMVRKSIYRKERTMMVKEESRKERMRTARKSVGKNGCEGKGRV